MASTTYYVALPFIDSEDGPAPGEASEWQSAGSAKAAAQALSRNKQYIGAIAFQRTGDPDEGVFGDADVLAKFGDVPKDLSEL